LKHIFDLDLTIWETFDKYGHKIWAKQMLFPITLISDECAVDDVGSKCVLKTGIKEYLIHLKSNDVKIGYLSCGRHWYLADDHQPSLKLLQLFGIDIFFDDLKVLCYKVHKKSIYIRNINDDITFYDDDEKVIEDLKKIPRIQIVDAKLINDWKLKIGDLSA
jgi:hypothetical protein